MLDNNALEYVQELRNSKSEFEDCHFRNIIGRAYYYAYHEARIHLENRLKWPITQKKGGVHFQLCSRLAGYPESTPDDDRKRAAELQSRLTKLKAYRTTADYKLNEKISIGVVDFVLEEAEALSEEMAAL